MKWKYFHSIMNAFDIFQHFALLFLIVTSLADLVVMKDTTQRILSAVIMVTMWVRMFH